MRLPVRNSRAVLVMPVVLALAFAHPLVAGASSWDRLDGIVRSRAGNPQATCPAPTTQPSAAEAIDSEDDAIIDAHPSGPVDYLIVTQGSLEKPFKHFASWKERRGIRTEVQTLASIRRRFPVARDDAERIRLCIRDAYARGARWALLGGDTGLIPTRYAHTEFFTPTDFPSDRYFACLDGTWDADGDGRFAEVGTGGDPGDDADLVPEVHVGRAPVRTAREAKAFIEKTKAWETRHAPSRRSVLMLAEVLFPYPWDGVTPPALDGARFAEDQLPGFLSAGAEVTRCYQNHADPSYAPGAVPEHRTTALDQLSRDHDLTFFIGHGSVDQMSVGSGVLDIADVSGLESRRPTNLYSLTSYTHAIDQDCIAEALIRNPDGGAVTSIGPTTLEFLTAGNAFMREYCRLLNEEGATVVGELFDRHLAAFEPFAMFDGVYRVQLLSTVLLGDPQLALRNEVDADTETPIARRAGRLDGRHDGVTVADNESAVLVWDRAAAATANMRIYDPFGRSVRAIEGKLDRTGRFSARWDLRNARGMRVAPGVYFARADEGAVSLRIVVLR